MLDEKTLKIDVFSKLPWTPIVMHITHIPTGIMVESEDSSLFKLKARLLDRLENKLHCSLFT